LKDALGTKIYEGNRVAISLGGAIYTGIVKKVEDGGLALVGNGTQAIRQGEIVLEVQVVLNWVPGPDRLTNVFLTMNQDTAGKAAFETTSDGKVIKPS
jgi:hypothetical protein